jgi:membrane protease YdiL (CAAX protease family)
MLRSATGGALDSFVSEGQPQPDWLSAAYISALWGAWHLPLVFPTLGWLALPSLLALQIAVGMPLSSGWRKSGNLLVPGVTHAVIDAVRNGLGGV